VVEKIQDTVVAPAIIACEQLEFDRVSLKHILRAAREFYACGSTTMLPDCDSRVYFITCHLARNPAGAIQIVHHGVSYAYEKFDASIRRCYQNLSNAGQWVDAFVLRGQVCLDLGIQQEVFNQCFDTYVQGHPGSVRTELSFKSEPVGEKSIEVRGKDIGLIQLSL
jgi:hypothetical protein